MHLSSYVPNSVKNVLGQPVAANQLGTGPSIDEWRAICARHLPDPEPIRNFTPHDLSRQPDNQTAKAIYREYYWYVKQRNPALKDGQIEKAYAKYLKSLPYHERKKGLVIKLEKIPMSDRFRKGVAAVEKALAFKDPAGKLRKGREMGDELIQLPDGGVVLREGLQVGDEHHIEIARGKDAWTTVHTHPPHPEYHDLLTRLGSPGDIKEATLRARRVGQPYQAVRGFNGDYVCVLPHMPPTMYLFEDQGPGKVTPPPSPRFSPSNPWY